MNKGPLNKYLLVHTQQYTHFKTFFYAQQSSYKIQATVRTSNNPASSTASAILNEMSHKTLLIGSIRKPGKPVIFHPIIPKAM